MKLSKLLVFGCVIFLLLGCATFSEPASDSDTLAIGIVIQTGENFGESSGATVSGINKSGIDLTIMNIDTNREYRTRTRTNGLFSVNKLPEGTYRINKLYIKVESGRAMASLSTSPINNYTFTVMNGKVNNLGVINWDSKLAEGTTLKFSHSYDDVKKEFVSQYPSSKWQSREMVNIAITVN